MAPARCISHAFIIWIICNIHSTSAQDWTLTNSNGSIEVPGTVPGGVYSDLLSAGVLKDGDFYYRYNDVNYRWVSKDNWTYSTTFDVTPELVEYERVVLIFEGLDTVAEVVLNDHIVGRTNNMFVRYVFDVKEQLQPGIEATLEVKFESPVAYSRDAYEQQLHDYIVPPKCVPNEYHGECHANHIRKMQASFAWDWGPAFPNMGIWKPWRLVGFDSLLITDILFTATPTTTLPTKPDLSLQPGWNVTLEVIFDASISSGTKVGTLEITLGNVKNTTVQATATTENFEATTIVTFNLDENLVDLWWPNGIGYGHRPLYSLSVKWISETGSETSSKSIQVGFRTVELNQDFLDESNETLGRHYRVIVNNVTMFMKGSNWIPAHVLPEMVSEEYTKELLYAAEQTYQNCIRVWGGGIYESDEFYQFADERGLLIWQDFMFACSMYPVDQPFLDTVTSEVRTQVRRLQHHPSVLLWAANNENEAALRGNWYGTAPDFDHYKEDYKKLYVETVRNVTQSIDNIRPFVVSSPNNGIESEEEGHVAINPYSNLYGDVHYYNYISDAWNWKIYPPTRFASEYGFQSWPSFSSMKNVTSMEDWMSTSPLSYHRQHHPGGQEELNLEIGLHMHLPHQNGSEKSYKDYLYLSQIHQAVAIKTETEFYRRGMSSVNDMGEGYISGALYWQLNDIWQGPSWSSIEFGGRWKMLHYYVKKFFYPVMVSLYLNNDELEVAVINDHYETFEGITLTIDVHRYDQMKAVASYDINVNATAMEANVVKTFNLWDDLKLGEHCQLGLYDELDVCFVVSNAVSTSSSHPRLYMHSNYLLLGKPKDAALSKATVEVKSIAGPPDPVHSCNCSFTVTLTSDNVALFVWLEVDVPGRFSDNGFLMTKEELEIEFVANQETTEEALKESMKVTTLTDTYSTETVARARAEAVMDRARHPNDIGNLLYV